MASEKDAGEDKQDDRTMRNDTEVTDGITPVPQPGPGRAEETAAATTDQPQQLHDDEAFSAFTPNQIRAVLIMASFCAFFSPTTASIYFPALDVISRDLHVSNTAINLTVTTYLILQGIAPTFVGGFSDTAGRRPAYIICFIIYIAANIGLGAQNSYAALLVLRCVQSAGSSGTVALASGVTSDIVSAAERGSYIALTSMGALLGPVIGPILGGLLSQFLGWHWIFWFLAILSGAVFIPLLLLFPETNRRVVGDGSHEPPLHCKSLATLLINGSMKKRGIVPDAKKQEELRKNYKIRFPNPFAALLMAFDKSGIIVLLSNALVIATMYVVLTGISSLFGDIYGFNQIQTALCFIPFGVGGIISSFMTGKMLDWNYRRHAGKLGLEVVKNRRQDITNFPIERARIEIAFPMLVAGMLVTIAYGWVLDFRTNLAGPLVLLFFIGIITTGAYQATNILMIDNYPDKAATATAANNLFRCLLGAGATAILGPLLNAWGPGWTYTFAALLFVAYCPALLALAKYGPQWRRARLERERVKKEKKQQQKLAVKREKAKEDA